MRFGGEKFRGIQIPLNIWMIVLVMTIFIVIGSIIATVSFQYHKRSVVALSEQLISQIAISVTQKMDSYMRPAIVVSDLLAEMFEQYQIISPNQSDIQNLLINSMSNYKQLGSTYIGFANGDFLQVSQGNEWIINRMTGVSDMKTQIRLGGDKNVKSVRQVSKEGYDPRVRPWYQGAFRIKNTYWTDPYEFFESKKIGITLAAPILNEDNSIKGIVGIDIFLDELTSFLTSLEITQSSHIAIVDSTGQFIAKSGPMNLPDELGENNSEIYSRIINYKNDDQSYIAIVEPLDNFFSKDWKTVMIIPKQELFAALIKANKAIVLWGTTGLLISIMFIVIFARRVSFHIEQIAKRALQIKEFKLDQALYSYSHIKEIHTLKEAFDSMQVSIKSFMRYVPVSIVKKLVKQKKEAQVGAIKRDMSVLFTDIKNFTELAESTEPNQLARQLSKYFNIMADSIRGCNGIIDKYVGDAVMAMWGAPKKNKYHAFDACRCGLILKDTLQNMENPFNTRIAIHSGEMIVGNIGATDRFNYTAIGKNVNIAHRLESLNKFYDTCLLISGDTYKIIKDKFICRPLDKVVLKGMKQPIQVYELLKERDKNDKEFDEFIQHFCESHHYYYRKKWQKALEGFESLKTYFPNDPILQYYISSSKKYVNNPPDKSWSGIVYIKHK